MNASRPQPSRIVLVDGHCLLCQAWVRFLLRHDPAGRFRFAALQADVAEDLLRRRGFSDSQIETWRRGPRSRPASPHSGPGSVLYLDGERLFRRSGAALRILRDLGFPWSLAGVLLLLPAPIRDGAYDLVARHRYRWFGRSTTCMVPPDRYRDRFLEDPAPMPRGKEPTS